MMRMNSMTNTESLIQDSLPRQENILLLLIKELCTENKISERLKGKVTRIIADCDLSFHASLHKLSTADESTTSVLGFMKQTSEELTFDEQMELNQAIIHKIQTKLPSYTNELDEVRKLTLEKNDRLKQTKNLQTSLDEKLRTLQEQENEKVELMMEWLNHRVSEVSQFNNNTAELLTLKTKILDLKSKILHMQILHNIFSETNQSLKAYKEVHKDLKDRVKESEQNIKKFNQIIENDFKQYS